MTLLSLKWQKDFSSNAIVRGSAQSQALQWLLHQKRAILVGPKYSGKTHLAHLWASANEARLVSGFCTANNSNLVYENIGAVDASHEIHCMRLFNQCTDTHILFTSVKPCHHWACNSHDVMSRLKALPVLVIPEVDTQSMPGILEKQLADYGLHLESKALAYVMSRLEKSYTAIYRFVESLNNYCAERSVTASIHVASYILSHSIC